MITVDLHPSDGNFPGRPEYFFVVIRGMPGDKFVCIGNARSRDSAEKLKAKVEQALREFVLGPQPENDKRATLWEWLAQDD